MSRYERGWLGRRFPILRQTRIGKVRALDDRPDAAHELQICVPEVRATQVDDGIGHGSPAADNAQRGVNIFSGFLMTFTLVFGSMPDERTQNVDNGRLVRRRILADPFQCADSTDAHLQAVISDLAYRPDIPVSHLSLTA